VPECLYVISLALPLLYLDEVLQSLAISFTNESYDRASHTMLLRWFRARYPSAHVPEETLKAMGTNSSWDTHGRITELFLDMARTQHAQDDMDEDLQIALGVLFYTNGEYERAHDCFTTALNVRPGVSFYLRGPLTMTD